MTFTIYDLRFTRTLRRLWFCLLPFALCLASGCVNLAKTVKELAKDPATTHLSVRSIYVTIEVERTNPLTNTLPHSIGKDGAITVNARP